MRPIVSASLAISVTALMLSAVPIEPGRSAAERAESVSAARRTPAAPRSVVETAFPSIKGRTIHVPSGGDLQKALNEAKGGDRITLEPRAMYRGPFHLPAKEGSNWIVISTASSSLPREGRRVSPADAAAMPKLVAASEQVLETEPGAHHYRFVGLEMAPQNGVFLQALVRLGDNDTEVNTLPHHLVFDRCYLHGDPKLGARRGIAMNSRETAVIDSYLSDFKEVGADSQAIASWNGAGPFKIANSYLEAAGENVMFGGGDPTVRDLVPSDIEIRDNHFAKPLRWKIGHPTFEGTEWAVKNLFELKNARRVLIDGNLLEYNWPHAQNGFAILFTVRNQDGRAPWSVVEDVTFSNNVVQHVGAGINVLARDDNYPSQRTSRLAIRNNLFLDVGGAWGHGRLLQLLDGVSDVIVDHNTSFQTGGVLFGGDNAAHPGFVFENNITIHHPQSISGSSSEAGVPALNRYFPAAVVRRNVFVGGSPAEYPPDNFFPPTLDDVGFVGARDGRFRLARQSRYARAGTDGRDPGANAETLDTALTNTTVPVAFSEAADSSAPVGDARVGAGYPIALWLFSVALFLLAYVYVGYPLVAALRSRFFSRPHVRAPIEPFVSILIPAYNEGSVLAARIENLLALDYPHDRLEIIVGSDGSTDNTFERVREFASRGVKLMAFPTRRGKARMINTLVSSASGEIIVFADARQRFDRNAVRALVADFADPAVGAVSGELLLEGGRDAAAAGAGASFYWRYEKFIRSAESRVDSTLGATGAIYAIRRSLFEPIPRDTILDDVLVPAGIVRRGYRVLFEPQARAYDQVASTARDEFARKARTIAGNFQLLTREPWLFSPLHNRLWFQTMSHKALRLALPWLHVALLVTNVLLASTWPFGWILAGQLAFYAAAFLGQVISRPGRRLMFISVPYAVCLLSWATLVGFFRFVSHSQPVTWERVPRPAVVSSSPRRVGA
jgi:biofilm PGA synthesis N-glycosyltransferase PgaC